MTLYPIPEDDKLIKKRNVKNYEGLPFIIYRDMMQSFDTYIVSATHPEQPNFDGTSRGRKRHLSQSNETGTLTLCNMLVAKPFEEIIDIRLDDGWENFSVNNGLCGNCKIEFNKTHKKHERIK